MAEKTSNSPGGVCHDQTQAHIHDGANTPSLNPARITLETFHRLLSCYEATVSQLHRRKAVSKLQPKAAKGSKGNSGVPVIPKTELNESEEKQIREQTDKFLELDRWRYETLPKTIAERRARGGKKKGDETEGAHLLKEELVGIMDWKMKHGVFRPALMGMIKSNPDNTVTQSTSDAFAIIPDADPISAPAKAFPRPSLDALTTRLRGVGPATASLILSIGTIFGDAKSQIPFYSDDVYLWLVLDDLREYANQEEKPSTNKKPSGELIAKYNVNEYRSLWDAVQELRARLGNDVSLIDIEKVAYVIRHIDVSGFVDRSLETSLEKPVVDEPLDQETGATELSKKRKPKVERTEMPVRRESKRLKQGLRN